MSHRKNYNLRRKILIHNAEEKLSAGIFSAILEVEGPAMGTFSDFSNCLLKGTFKVDCGD